MRRKQKRKPKCLPNGWSDRALSDVGRSAMRGKTSYKPLELSFLTVVYFFASSLYNYILSSYLPYSMAGLVKKIEINCDMGEGFGRWKMVVKQLHHLHKG